MALTPFDIHLEPGSGSKIVINGEDVTDRLVQIAIERKVGEHAVVHAVMLGQGRIDGEGIVTQYIDLDQRQVVQEFLSRVDSRALEAAALDRMDDLSVSTGKAFLDVLKEMVADVHDNGA